MEIILAALGSFVLDLLLGDPAWMPHPVIYMGKAISFLEKHLRAAFGEGEEQERTAGNIMVVILVLGTFVFSSAVLSLLGRLHPWLRYALEVIWGWQCLAMRDLKKESMFVYEKLTTSTLEEARSAVGRIVGRDTGALSHEGVTKAAVETVAENFSDGVAAPMIYLLIGGAPLALAYKAVNTMDSMVGYKNDRYLHFGRRAALLDDVVNYIPARVAAWFLILSAALVGEDASNALRIWRRDKRNHASPNSAQTESAAAGALRVQLAGPAYYFGKLHDKPYIGDPITPITPDHIKRVNRLMYGGGFISIAVLCLLRYLAVVIF